MRGWKWVVLMWSSIIGIVVTRWAVANPIAFAKWFVTPGNAQLLSLLISAPFMIWMVKIMKDMFGMGGKDPRKWWKEDEDKGQF